MLPGQPPTFRQPSASDRAWWWRLEDAAGETVELEGHSDQRFGNQGDAESWVGETFSDLAADGVDGVTLFEGDRRVYGPMSLHA